MVRVLREQFSAESAGSQDHAAAALLLAAQETRSRHFAFALPLRHRQLFCDIFRLHLRVVSHQPDCKRSSLQVPTLQSSE
jgi:hypothetical protein